MVGQMSRTRRHTGTGPALISVPTQPTSRPNFDDESEGALLLVWAETNDFPALALNRCMTIGAGQDGWYRFLAHPANAPLVTEALVTLGLATRPAPAPASRHPLYGDAPWYVPFSSDSLLKQALVWAWQGQVEIARRWAVPAVIQALEGNGQVAGLEWKDHREVGYPLLFKGFVVELHDAVAQRSWSRLYSLAEALHLPSDWYETHDAA